MGIDSAISNEITQSSLPSSIMAMRNAILRKTAPNQKNKTPVQAEKTQNLSRRNLLKALGGGMVAATIAVVDPEIQQLSKGALITAWESLVNGKLNITPLIDSGEKVITETGIPFFNRIAKNLYQVILQQRPDIFTNHTAIPEKITNPLQPSDEKRYPHSPPEMISDYLNDTEKINTVMTDGLAQLYLDGQISYSDSSQQKPLLMAELQAHAKPVVEKIREQLTEQSLSGQAVSDLNPKTRNHGALVTNALVMREFLDFLDQNQSLAKLRISFVKTHDVIAGKDIFPQVQAAIARHQTQYLELAYRKGKLTADISQDTLSQINLFKSRPEFQTFNNIFVSVISPVIQTLGLKDAFAKQLTDSLFINLALLHMDGIVNLDLFKDSDPQNIKATLLKLVKYGSQYQAYNFDGSAFSPITGAGIVLGRSLQPGISHKQEILKPNLPRLSRRTFLVGTVGIAATAAYYDLQINQTPALPTVIFDQQSFDAFLQKAPVLTYADIDQIVGESSRFNFSDGTPLEGVYERTLTQLRQSYPGHKIPAFLKQAVVNTEDLRIDEHDGVDPIALVRAAAANLKGNRIEGGSTIAMQLAKILFEQTTVERGWEAKKQEMLGAMFLVQHARAKIKADGASTNQGLTDTEIRKKASDKIVSDYLNVVNYGPNIAGIKKAAEIYFNTDPEYLTEIQQLYLAGLPKSPNSYNPFVFEEGRTGQIGEHGILLSPSHLSVMRMKTIIDMLQQSGKITSDQANSYYAEIETQGGILISNKKQNVTAEYSYVYNLFNQVPSAVQKTGVEVVTTFDKAISRKVDSISKLTIAKLSDLGINGIDIVVRDCDTGKILALSGLPGKPRQLGEIATVITGAVTLEVGDNPEQEQKELSTNWKPTITENLHKPEIKPVSAFLKKYGIQKYVDMFKRLGCMDNQDQYNLCAINPHADPYANPGTNALRVSSAMATIAAHGKFVGSSGIESIKHSISGDLYHENSSQTGQQVIDIAVADSIIATLNNPQLKPQTFATLDNRYLGVTGISTNLDSETFNSWCAGYAVVKGKKYQVTCVAYNDDSQGNPIALTPQLTGENSAGVVYRQITDFLYDNFDI